MAHVSAHDPATRFDAIVIGSGIGGLAAAAALTEQGRRVLVLERHTQAGGLTQTFEREGFRFNVGVHYLGGFGAGEIGRRLFDRLAGTHIEMAPIPGVYDRVHFPDFNLAFTPPAEHLQLTLTTAFPHEADGIAQYFAALDDGADALGAAFAVRSAPPVIAKPLGWVKRHSIERWVGRTTWEVVQECVQDPKLAALLCAQWGDYGSRPLDGSFGAHATVMKHYLNGAWYPVGGAGVFARAFGARITAGGGAVRTGAQVVGVRVHQQVVQGVQLADGSTLACPLVISDIGLHNTLRLLPSADIDYGWADDALALPASLGHVGLYLGLEGDIAAHGADTANTWLYEQWDVNRLWTDPFTEPRAPAMFVSFPSLRDPAHDPGPQRRHTCEIVALVDWNAFAQWDRDDGAGARGEGYAAFKQMIERNLLAQFAAHFPDLAPMVKLTVSSTPLSVAAYTGAEHGALYGLATTPARFLTPALKPHTPIGGLLLAGQDVGMPGVMGAFMGGLMAAASVEPALWRLLR